MNWLELVWLGKTENTEEHLCSDKYGVRKFGTIRRQPESARWRREFVDKLTVQPQAEECDCDRSLQLAS